MRFRGLLVFGMVLFALGAALGAGLPSPEAPVAYDIAGCGVVVSAAPLAAALGGRLSPTGGAGEYAFEVGARKVVLALDSVNAKVGGKAVRLLPAPFAVPELEMELFVPLSPLIEALGGKVKRDKSPIAVITLPGQPGPLQVAVSAAGGKDDDGKPLRAGEVLVEIAGSEKDAAHLWVMKADGADLTRVTWGKMDASLPSYSKSGDRFVYLRTLREDFSFVTFLGRRGPKSLTTQFTQIDPFKMLPGKRDAVTSAFVYGVNLSPDGGTILLTIITLQEGKEAPVCSIIALPFEGGNARLLAADAGEPCWSPDGKRVAYTSTPGGKVMIIDADGKAKSKVEVGAGSGPVFSRDGRQLLFRQFWPNDVTSFSVAHIGDEITVSELPAGKRIANEEGAAFTPEASALIISRRGDGLLRVNIDRGEETPIPSEGFDSSPTLSPDGQWLYFLRGGQLHRMQIAGGPATRLTDGEPLRGYTLSPDGQSVWVLRAEE